MFTTLYFCNFVSSKFIWYDNLCYKDDLKIYVMNGNVFICRFMFVNVYFLYLHKYNGSCSLNICKTDKHSKTIQNIYWSKWQHICQFLFRDYSLFCVGKRSKGGDKSSTLVKEDNIVIQRNNHQYSKVLYSLCWDNECCEVQEASAGGGSFTWQVVYFDHINWPFVPKDNLVVQLEPICHWGDSSRTT